MALPSDAEITVRYADGHVLHYPAVTTFTLAADYPDSEYRSLVAYVRWEPGPVRHTLSFYPQGEYTITAPPEETKQERWSRMIREMYPHSTK